MGALAETGKPSPAEPGPADLMALYRIAFDDRNFQVSLNWDRTKHYFIFNFALFSIAGGLSSIGEHAKIPQLIIYVLAVLNSLFGAHSIRRGHEYYRETRDRLQQIEARVIGGPSAEVLSMHTTRGMKRARAPEPARKTLGDRVTVTALAIAFQLVMAGAAAGALAWRLSF